MSATFAYLLAMPAALGLVVKVTCVLTAGALAALFARRQPAATRHFIWLVALSSALALALLTPIAPRVMIPVTTRLEEKAFVSATPAQNLVVDHRRETPGDGVKRDRTFRGQRLDIASALGLTWLAGSLAVLLWCLLGHLGLARLARNARPIERRDGEVRLGAVRLGSSPSVGSPLTWGWPRSVILLPEEATSWPAERRRVALLHELAHVARRDYLTQLIGTLTCAVYWFHPLVWLAASRLRAESEHACDDRMLADGVPPHAYASTLLQVARRGQARLRVQLAGVGMARSSRLEARLLAVLDDARRRGPLPRRSAAMALAVAGLLLVPFAGLVPRLISPAAARPSADSAGPGTTIERTISAGPGRQLRLDLETGGELDIRGWERSAVQVRAMLRGKDWRDTRVDVQPEGEGVLVRSEQADHDGPFSTSHAFEIRVPRRFDVRLRSAGGGITIVDVDGTFRGNTGGGKIVLERDKGSAYLTTGGGDVRVSDSELDGSVTTGGGEVTISNVRGDLRTMGDGEPENAGDGKDRDDEPRITTYGNDEDDSREPKLRGDETRAGVLRVSKAGGDVDLGEAPHGARITTGGGDIHIGRAGGSVRARTGGGDIEIGPVAGSVHAGTGAGNVRVSLAAARGESQSVEITSGTGDIVIEVPEGFDGRIELETAYTRSFRRATRIEAPWNLERESTTRWDASEGTPRRYVRARGMVGQGRGLIQAHTVNGDIEVRRASDGGR